MGRCSESNERKGGERVAEEPPTAGTPSRGTRSDCWSKENTRVHGTRSNSQQNPRCESFPLECACCGAGRKSCRAEMKSKSGSYRARSRGLKSRSIFGATMRRRANRGCAAVGLAGVAAGRSFDGGATRETIGTITEMGSRPGVMCGEVQRSRGHRVISIARVVES